MYAFTEEKECNQDIGEYVTYAIVGERISEGRKESIERIVVHDVTTKREFAKKIVGLCERNQVSLIHLREVIEDLLCVEL